MRLITLLLLLSFLQVSAQEYDYTLWTDHFSFNNVHEITQNGDILYCISEAGLFYFDKSDPSITKLSKVNGLNDVKITASNFDSVHNFLILGYSNGNLDIVSSSEIDNFPILKQKQMMVSKTINDIYVLGDNAYLATDFGIVVFDLNKKEFKDTYIIGKNGMYSKVNKVLTDSLSNKIYATTSEGILYADLNSPNLLDFNSWFSLPGTRSDNYSEIVKFSDKLIFLQDNDTIQDSIMVLKDGVISPFYKQWKNVQSICINANKLVITSFQDIFVFDNNLTVKKYIDSTNNKIYQYNYSIIDEKNNIWAATPTDGVMKYGEEIKKILPNGPLMNVISDLHYSNNKIYGSFGSKSIYQIARIGIFESNRWANQINYQVLNPLCIVARNKTNEFFYGTHFSGLVKCTSISTYDAIYNKANGGIPVEFATDDNTRTSIFSLAVDNEDNVWMTNWVEKRTMTVLSKDNVFYNFSISQVADKNVSTGLFIDSYNRKWVVNPGNPNVPAYVFDENGTFDDSSDDQFKALPLNDEEGSFADYAIAIVEDLDKRIWIGTNQGIATYSNIKNVFDDTDPVFSRIKVEENGNVGYLLGGEIVSCIAVDGGNRKWVGTMNSGVFLLSPDGKTQLKNFNVENSPMISNSITTIAINQESGEVFFGTDAGVVSYRSDASAGEVDMGSVYVYPNPVRENYNDLIYIKGLELNSTVKITDVNGGLVYETLSNGGTASWNGKNFNGNRVATGVYLVLCTNETGENTIVKKLLFIH